MPCAGSWEHPYCWNAPSANQRNMTASGADRGGATSASVLESLYAYVESETYEEAEAGGELGEGHFRSTVRPLTP